MSQTQGIINSKILQIVYSTIDVGINFQIDTTGNVYEQLLNKVVSVLGIFLYPGEQITDSSNGFQIKITKITS